MYSVVMYYIVIVAPPIVVGAWSMVLLLIQYVSGSYDSDNLLHAQK